MTGRSRVRVAVSSHCTGEGKACHWHPSPDPAQSGSSLHWVRPLFSTEKADWGLLDSFYQLISSLFFIYQCYLYILQLLIFTLLHHHWFCVIFLKFLDVWFCTLFDYMRLLTVPMERTSHYACAVACFSPGFVCINNSTIWRIFCEWLQEGFQNKGIYHFIVCINNIVLLQLIYLFYFTKL